MKVYCNDIINECPYQTNYNVNYPLSINFFNSEKDTELLNKKRSRNFSHICNERCVHCKTWKIIAIYLLKN